MCVLLRVFVLNFPLLLFWAFCKKVHNHHYRSFISGFICLSYFVCTVRERSTSAKAARRWRTRHTVWLCVIAKSHSNLRIDANNMIVWRDSLLMFHQNKNKKKTKYAWLLLHISMSHVLLPKVRGIDWCVALQNMTTSDMHKLSVTFQAKIITWNMHRKTKRKWEIRSFCVDIHDHTLTSVRGARQSILFYFRFDLFLSFAIFTSIETKRGAWVSVSEWVKTTESCQCLYRSNCYKIFDDRQHTGNNHVVFALLCKQ